jgi:hypothetical protein
MKTVSKSEIRVSPIKIKQSNFARPPLNKFVQIELTAKEIKEMLGGRISGTNILKKQKINYPREFYGIINQLNRSSHSTSPKRIGKVHNLFKQRKFRSLGEWEKWYNNHYPGTINKSINTIYDALIIGTDPSLAYRRRYKKFIRKFVKNLVINQTYTGLKIQEVILIKLSQIMRKNFKWSSGKEDSSGVDGYIGNIPISIKPKTSRENKKPGTKRVYYEIDENKHILKFSISL